MVATVQRGGLRNKRLIAPLSVWLSKTMRVWWPLVMLVIMRISYLTSSSVVVKSLQLKFASSPNRRPAQWVNRITDLFRAAYLLVLMHVNNCSISAWVSVFDCVKFMLRVSLNIRVNRIMFSYIYQDKLIPPSATQ